MFHRGLPAVACVLLASVSLPVSSSHAAPVPGSGIAARHSSRTAGYTPFNSAGAVLQWMNNYRDKPDPMRAAGAIHELSGLGELRNPESAGVYLGVVPGGKAEEKPAVACAMIEHFRQRARDDAGGPQAARQRGIVG